jgi:hypothetical protein
VSTVGILNQLAALQITISGIQAAYPNATDHEIPSRVLIDDELPMFVNIMGEERYTRAGNDLWEVDISLQAVLIVQRAVSGVPGEATAAVSPWRDTIADFFLARPTLDGYTGLLDEPDSGVIGGGIPGKVQWGSPNAVYLGCTYSFHFVELRLIESAE